MIHPWGHRLSLSDGDGDDDDGGGVGGLRRVEIARVKARVESWRLGCKLDRKKKFLDASIAFLILYNRVCSSVAPLGCMLERQLRYF